MQTLFINGKFAAQRVTGVQRLAASLIVALDQQLRASAPQDRWVLLCPPGARPPALERIEVRFSGPTVAGLHGWEQCFLPLYTAGCTLLNLAGPAPLLKRRQVCMVPDAAVFDQPQAYTRVFRIWYGMLFRSLARSARLLLTISEFSRQRLVVALRVDESRIRVVHCAATHMNDIAEDYSALDGMDVADSRYLLAVGSQNPTKNLPALIEAFHSLSDEQLRLVLVGGGNTAVFAAESALATKAPRVLRMGAISDGQLKALYTGAVAFVFPSLYEGFGLPPLEAMSLGCPVIASTAASIPEVCGDAAEYFDPSRPEDIAAAIMRVAGDPTVRARLREKGIARSRMFTWQGAASTLLTHLAQAGLTSDSVLPSPRGTVP